MPYVIALTNDILILSVRKQKRSRQSEVRSQLVDMIIMLGNHARNAFENNSEKGCLESNFVSNLPGTNSNRKEFRSVLNSNRSLENEKTLENTGILSEKLNSLMTEKSDDMKSSLTSHILQAINVTIFERFFPQLLQLSSEGIGRQSNLKMNLMSPELDRNPKGELNCEKCQNHAKMGFINATLKHIIDKVLWTHRNIYDTVVTSD